MAATTAYYIACALVFIGAYVINSAYVTIFYHRGFTHGALTVRPWAKKFIVYTGNWITGLDPLGWTCMHRMHHLYADTPRDPHSPTHQGVFMLMLGQLKSYRRALGGLMRGKEEYTSVVKDLDFGVNWLNRHNLWMLPYVLHAVIGLTLGLAFGAWLLGACYFVGMMMHPVQGWAVNSFGHMYGYRNFDTPDRSTNNTLVAWFVVGEGYQNNHHYSPQSAKFSMKAGEVDLGYGLCRLAEALGMVQIDEEHLAHAIPAARS